MKALSAWALLVSFPLLVNAAEPWRQVTMPTVSDAAASFANPPKEYGAIHWAIWGGMQTKERIIADIDRIAANGGGVYMINNSRNVQPPYLSPEYMDLVKTVVQECKKVGMKVWIEGDCGYPDGFAGGLISKDYPQLGMQGIVADARCAVAAGQTLDIPLPSDTLGILAYPRTSAAPAADEAPQGTPMPLPAEGTFKYSVPRGGAGEIVVMLPGAQIRYSVTVGEPFAIPVPAGTKGIFLTAGAGGGGRGRGGRGEPATVIPMPADGHFRWTAPAGSEAWDVTFIRHAYRTSPTRNDNGEDGGTTKDSLYTLIDYLDPAATDTYLKVIYGAYEKAVGDEFGKTVLGFRGDETDYTGVTPWTPKLLETFQAVKGYDLKPFIPLMLGGPMTPEAERAKADYWDVWSGMFRDNFYKRMQDWCTARNMEFMDHLNHEELMLSGGGDMIHNEGSFWRDMRYVGVPGIDNLNQIRPGLVADFPKLAASAAHLFGRALVWEEEGGSTGQAGKFVADYQLVRGVNYLNIRGMNTPPRAGGEALDDPASAIGHYVSRSQYLLAIGRPAAQVALFHPTDSMWLGDRESDDVTVKLVTQLLEHQIDFDHIDADTLATVCTLEDGGLKNLSGQVYRAVIVPTCTVIQKPMLDRLRAFAAAGGKVIFVGRAPSMVVDRTFLNAGAAPDLSFATLEPVPDLTERVIAQLPKPDVKLDSPCPDIKYIHRTLKDGEVYFFYNESAQPQTRTATLLGSGQVQVWDASDGKIHALAGAGKADGSIAVPLALAPYEARFIVIGTMPAQAAGPFPAIIGSQVLAALDGDWSVTVGQSKSETPLKSWQDMGAGTFAGTAEYHKTFDAPASLPQGRRVYLDLGNVGEIARVSVNGTALEPRNWPPYVWDITDAVKGGANALEVQVQTPPAGGRGGGGGFGQAGARAGRGRGAATGAATGPAAGAEASAARGDAAGRGPGAARGRGARGAGTGAGAQAAAPPAPQGLLGPVRLLAQ